MGEQDFSDLVALCHFLPGPTSSQLVFALGMHRAGLAGALLASFCFTMPSVILMIGFAYGVLFAGGFQHAGWLHGLRLAAVGVVGQAVWGMGRRLCFDRTTSVIAIGAVAIAFFSAGAAGQLGGISAGAIVGWLSYRKAAISPFARPQLAPVHRRGALFALGLFVAGLLFLPVLAACTGNLNLRYFDSFYRAGALVFGGGHVVLPMLQAELVPRGWISENSFLAGYGAVQAVPGPLFSFAAYLGTVMEGGTNAWVGGLLCSLAIFLPAWLMIGGALPFWHLLRAKGWARAAMIGANASVVGILLAAFCDPVCKQGITNTKDLGIAIAILFLLQVGHWPPWLVVAFAAAVGQWLL